jgi:chromosome segregation ATPase
VPGLVDSLAQHDPVPRSLFGIELAAKTPLHFNLVEGAERRVLLVEDQMVNLKELFQTQWGMCRQLKQDLATIQSDLDAAKLDVRTANFESTHLLSQVTIEVCGERDALKKQLESQASKLEQALMDMLQVEKDLESANKANASLSAQLDELTRLRSEQRADSTQQLARTTLQQQLDALEEAASADAKPPKFEHT